MLRLVVWVLLALLPVQFSNAAVASMVGIHQASLGGPLPEDVSTSPMPVDDGRFDCSADGPLDCNAACACTCHQMASALPAQPLPRERVETMFSARDPLQPESGLLLHRIERPKWVRIA